MRQGAWKAGVNGRPLLAVPAGTDIAGFTVEELLGAGASGAVYRARRGGALFALKLQPLEGLAGWAEREVAILLRLKHPNVVGFRACGTWPDLAPRGFYLAMELVEGRPLNLWMYEETFDARRVLLLVRGLARGLAVVHAADVLHRDIKESNIVVRTSDGEPVLVDFGVGDYAGAPRLTQGVLPPGTPPYRSPEALTFRETHCREPEARYTAAPTDDLFALGVVLYRVLTRQFPFPDVDFAGAAAMKAPPVPPHEANSRVPRALSTLCLRLLSLEPWQRGSAQALVEEVEALLAGADASWEVQLHEVTPLPSPADIWGALPGVVARLPATWLPPHRPRSGRMKPAADRPESPKAGRGARSEEALAPLPTAMSARGSEVRTGRSHAWSWRSRPAAVLAGLGACLAVVLARVPGEAPEALSAPRDGGVRVGWEVARSAHGLEPAGAALPPLAVTTSAAAAPAAPQQESDMPVQTTLSSTNAPSPSGGMAAHGTRPGHRRRLHGAGLLQRPAGEAPAQARGLSPGRSGGNESTRHRGR
ncbi:protein kinase domain-containing protein [Pyxidicoccus sp. 3LG]